MKPQHHLFLLMAFTICVQSCKKSSKNSGPSTAKVKYLTQAITVTTSSNGSINNSITTYTYDDKKRLSTTKQAVQGSNGQINISTYTYNGDQLYSIHVTYNGIVSSDKVFAYNNDGTLKTVILTTYRNGLVFNTVEYGYVYKDGKVSERHHEMFYELFTYDSNNNLIKSEGHGQFNIVVTYTYDDKKSLFTGLATKMELGGIDIDPAGDRYNTNNILTVTTTVDSGTPIDSGSPNYVYDSDGYPTGSSSGDATNGGKTSYTYSTLD